MALTITARVITPGQADFVMTKANGYPIVRAGLAPGAKVWRRQRADDSPFVHGSILIGRSLDIRTNTLAIRVEASTISQLATRILDLDAVMSRLAYTLEVVVDGLVMQWACECADSTPGDGGTFDDNGLRARYQLMTFSIPRSPIPLAGPL